MDHVPVPTGGCRAVNAPLPPPASPQGTTMLLPSSAHDPASMVAQALSIYGTVAGGGRRQEGEDAAAVAVEPPPPKPW